MTLSAGQKLKVSCYAGYRGEQEPRAFFLEDERVRVAEILDRWLTPAHRYFKCRSEDGRTFILRHDERQQEWRLTDITQDY